MKKIEIPYILLMLLMAVLSCSDSHNLETVILTLDDQLSANDISLNLKVDKGVYAQGQMPEVRIELINNSPKTINLIPSLDGSSDSMRYPIAGFHVFRNDTLIKPFSMRCGNMDGLRVDRIKAVKPSEHLDPQKSTSWVYQDHIITDSALFSKKGKYSIQYYYSTNQDTLSEWLGWNANFSLFLLPKEQRNAKIQVYQQKFASVPRLNLISQPVEFEVK